MRILSIDPGTNFLGVSIMDVVINESYRKPELKILHCASVNIESLATALYGETVVLNHGLRQAKVLACKSLLSKFLEEWEPNTVAIESPYMGRFPQAFSALVECMQALKLAVIEYDVNLEINAYDPSTVKKAVGSAKISSDKNSVKSAMVKHFPEIDFDDLDEHAIDSMAVGFTCFKSWLKHYKQYF